MAYKYVIILLACFSAWTADAQIGKRFPSEKKIMKDPVTVSIVNRRSER